MNSSKRTVRIIARNYSIDSDELLLRFWYRKERQFEYLKNENSVIRNKDLPLARELSKQENRTSYKKGISKKLSHKIKVSPAINYDYLLGKQSKDMKHLNKQEVIKIHEELEKDFMGSEDPILPPGIKSEDGLESALFHPQTSYCGQCKYKTVEAVGAALLYSISHNHCFHNGNKRTAIVSLLVFLDRHNIILTCDEDSLFKESVMIADHKIVDKKYLCSDAEIYEIMKWVCDNSKTIIKGERSISLRRLHQILNNFGCTINGNDIERIVDRKSIFGKNIKLRAKIPVTTKGREIDKGVMKNIREELELDAAHSIDLDTFYNGGESIASEFINGYKGLLKRLSKF